MYSAVGIVKNSQGKIVKNLQQIKDIKRKKKKGINKNY